MLERHCTEIIEDPRALFARCEVVRKDGGRVGLVPTMGALHDGHMSLVDTCAKHGATLRVMSIFVNPMQFGPSEDFGRYPRTFAADLERCRAFGVDVVYAPRPDTMYPPGFQTHVDVEGVTRRFEGEFRPTHFRGVTTVVMKLFMAVGACTAVFGRKDYQQWKTLARMTTDLDLPIELVGAPILREADGLAMSSRNRYLAADERVRALGLVEGLRAAYEAHAKGERDGSVLASVCRDHVSKACDHIDYVAAAHADTLEELTSPTERMVLLIAAKIGSTRLIDNLCLGEDLRP